MITAGGLVVLTSSLGAGPLVKLCSAYLHVIRASATCRGPGVLLYVNSRFRFSVFFLNYQPQLEA